MTRERFTYELIDRCLYLVSLHCVLMENYTQRDRTSAYKQCSDVLGECFDFYDWLYEEVDANLYSEEAKNANLEFLVQQLRNWTINYIKAEVENGLCLMIGDGEAFVRDHLLYKEGEPQELSNESLIRFVTQLREQEEVGVCTE